MCSEGPCDGWGVIGGGCWGRHRWGVSPGASGPSVPLWGQSWAARLWRAHRVHHRSLGQYIPGKGHLSLIGVVGPCGARARPSAGRPLYRVRVPARTRSHLGVRNKEVLGGIHLCTMWREMGKSESKRGVGEVPEEPCEAPAGTGGHPRACGDICGWVWAWGHGVYRWHLGHRHCCDSLQG